MGLAAKLALAALAVGAVAGGTWFAVNSQNNRATPAAQTTQNAPAGPTVLTGVLELPVFIVDGPSAVPYGEPAVFTVTVENPGSFGAFVIPDAMLMIGSDAGYAWSIKRGNDIVDKWSFYPGPGESRTFTATYPNTRLEQDGMGVYTVRFSGGGFWQDPDATDFYMADYVTMLTIASPVRPLDPDWSDYCQSKQALYSAEAAAGAMEQVRDYCRKEGGFEASPLDPMCPADWDQLNELLDEINTLLLRVDALEAERFSYMDDDGLDNRFPTLSDQYACDCWCNTYLLDPETGLPWYVCDNIPWGTTADLPSYTPEPPDPLTNR